MNRTEVPVLIVGAGPVGMMASLLLARRGIASLVVDRRDGPHRAPQAHCINARSLEICRTVGIDMERLRAHATRREDGSVVRWMTTLTGEELGCLPYERQGDENLVYTPTPLLNLSQHLFEPILLDSLTDEPLSEVRWRLRWTALEQDDDGVTSRVDDLATGDAQEVRSRYLLAADGAGSAVRKALGIEMDGPASLQSFVMIHFRAGLRDLVRDRPAILYWLLDPATPGTLVAHDIDHTWVFMHPYDPDTESRESYTEDVCAGLVRRALGTDDARFEVRDISTWTMTAQVAERYRDRRAFLVGDSAHRFPPSGGMGMNTGIQDAHNLAWKLAAVESSAAAPALLDTYESERRPVARTNADQSLANALKLFEVLEAIGASDPLKMSQGGFDECLGSADGRARLSTAIDNQREHFDMFGLQLGFRYEAGALVPDGSQPPACTDPVHDFVPSTRPGSRVAHAWVEAAGVRVSVLDLLPYDAFTLITGRDCAAWHDAAARLGRSDLRCLRLGEDFQDPEGHWASVCEIDDDGALLVRPDQHVAWRSRGSAGDADAALAAAVRGTVQPADVS